MEELRRSQRKRAKEKPKEEVSKQCKPEKVKSRWRRSSELENVEMNGTVDSVPLKSQTEISKIEKKVMSTPIIEVEECVSVDANVSSNPEPVVPQSETVIPEKETVIPEKETVIPEKETIISEKETIISENKTAVSENEPVVSENTSEVVKEPMVFDCEIIEENVYSTPRKLSKSKKEVGRMLCDCTLTKEEYARGIRGCAEKCLNRLLMIECGSRCGTGDACSNKRFQKREYVKTEPFDTGKKGWGLRILEDVAAESFVMEYVGEVLGQRAFKQRVKQYAREKKSHYYFMALTKDEIIDATCKGNYSRFINHSCDPNCETQKWTVNGVSRIGFFTKKAMKAGDELTLDYKFQVYGREAQKCFCESEKCLGYIGETKSMPAESNNSSKTSNRRKKTSEEKRRAPFQDVIVEQEIEKLNETVGLRTKNEVLILAGLMVRVEDMETRLRLLDIILKTSQQACLRLFIDYQGISLIWCWMADTKDLKLRLKILEVLSILPIPNKTILIKSKVLELVEKWSQLSFTALSAIPSKDGENSNEPSVASPARQSTESFAKRIRLSETLDTESSETGNMETKIGISDDIIRASISADNNIPPKYGDNSNDLDVNLNKDNASADVTMDVLSKSDDDSGDTVEEEDDKQNYTELAAAAVKLLESWKSLKEVFHIPKVEQQKKKENENEAEKRDDKSSDTVDKGADNETSGNSEVQKNNDDAKYAEAIHNLCKSKDNKWGHSRNNRVSFDSSRPRKVLLPTPVGYKRIPTLSKDRANVFPSEVQQRDESVLKQVEITDRFDSVNEHETKFNEVPVSPFQVAPYNQMPDPKDVLPWDQNSNLPRSENFKFQSWSIEIKTSGVEQNVGITPQGRMAILPPQMYTESPQLQVPLASPLADVPSPALYPPSLASIPFPPPQLPFIRAPPPTVLPPQQQPPPNVIPISRIDQIPLPAYPVIPNSYGIPTTAIPTPLTSSTIHSNPSSVAGSAELVYPPFTSNQNSGNAVSTEMVYPPYAANHTLSNATAPTELIYPSYATNQNPSSIAGTTELVYPQFPPTQNQPAFEVQPSVAPVVQNPSPKPTKLPPNWKTATDSEGTVYYYHVFTRQTQWEFPTSDQIPDDSDDSAKSTPTFDEPQNVKRKGSSSILPDTSYDNEIAKKIKDRFRAKLSSFVVQCLNPYRKPDCEIGRITCTEDFKHLARKLTHFVIVKEVKHCKNIQLLDYNSNVKNKAKDFIKKYMSKCGPVYGQDHSPES